MPCLCNVRQLSSLRIFLQFYISERCRFIVISLHLSVALENSGWIGPEWCWMSPKQVQVHAMCQRTSFSVSFMRTCVYVHMRKFAFFWKYAKHKLQTATLSNGRTCVKIWIASKLIRTTSKLEDATFLLDSFFHEKMP